MNLYLRLSELDCLRFPELLGLTHEGLKHDSSISFFSDVFSELELKLLFRVGLLALRMLEVLREQGSFLPRFPVVLTVLLIEPELKALFNFDGFGVQIL